MLKSTDDPRWAATTVELTKALTGLTTAVKAVSASVGDLSKSMKKDVGDLKKELVELKKLREGDVRIITARVSSISTHVSYMRQNLCETLEANKGQVLNVLEKKVTALRDYVNNCTEAEIVVFRDYMVKAFPELHASPQNALPDEVSTPVVPPPPHPSPVAKSHVPPVAILEDVHNADVKMSDAQINTNIKAVVPFSNDLEIWGLFRIKGVDKHLAGYLEERLPADLDPPHTANDKYVAFIVTTLFENKYREDHAVPKENNEVTSSFPYLPKTIIQLLHRLGLAGKNMNADFDMEKYWRDVRRYFRDSEIHVVEAQAMPATHILERARGVVAQERQVLLMERNMSRSAYQNYLKEMEDLRSFDEAAGAVAHQPRQADKTADTTLDTTQLNLRSRTVRASKTSEVLSASENKVMRRRHHDETSEHESEAKKTKQ